MGKDNKSHPADDCNTEWNFFGAFLDVGSENTVELALRKYSFTKKEQNFIRAYFSAVKALVDGKAVPYSFEIGSKYDYTDAVIRYACGYIVDINSMYEDIEEYANWFLGDDMMQVIKNPPDNKITIIKDFLKSEFKLASSIEINENNASDIEKEIGRYISDPARGYNKRNIDDLQSYADAVEPNYNVHQVFSFEEMLNELNISLSKEH